MDALHPGRAGSMATATAEIAHAAILPLAIGLLSYAAVAQGGFYRTAGSFLAAGLTSIALAATSSAAGLGPLFLGAAALTGGLVVPAIATEWGANTPQMVASLCAAIAVVPVTRHVIASGERERLLSAIAWIGAASALVGTLGVAFHRTPWAAPASGLWRNASTLTYANAAGCLFVLSLGASLLLLLDNSSPLRRLAAFLTLVGLCTTVSRGAAVACVAGIVMLAAFRSAHLLRALRRPAAGALCAVALFIPSIGGPARPAIALAGLIAGAAIACSGAASASRRQLAIGAAVLVPVALVAASAAIGRVLERRALPASETRLRTWGAVLDRSLERPVLGHGPGTFSIVENDPKRGPVLTRYVHNEYLQVFYETGLFGLAAVAAAIAVFGRWIWRRRRNEPAWIVAGAMTLAFAAHSGLDFLWRFPLLVALAFMWCAVAVTPPPDEEESI